MIILTGDTNLPIASHLTLKLTPVNLFLKRLGTRIASRFQKYHLLKLPPILGIVTFLY